MKQRSRSMHSGDDLNCHTMVGKKGEESCYDSELPLHRFKPQEHFIEAQVQEGDTLQAIALRFYCSISELKRVNQIHKDNEIYARRTIKVPVTPYSVLTELVPAHPPPQPEPSTSKHTSTVTVQDLLSPVQKIITNKEKKYSEDKMDREHCSIDCNLVILNSTLAPSVIPYTDAEVPESGSEETRLLPERTKASVEAVVVKELTSHGADFGLKWFHLVCFVIILGVVIPLVYIVFYLDKTEHEHLLQNNTYMSSNSSFHNAPVAENDVSLSKPTVNVK